MKKFLFVPIAGAILSLGALTAQAAETFSIVLDPTPATVGVSGSAVPAFSSVSAGQFLVTPNGGSLAAYGPSFYTFCVELTQYYSNPAVAAYNYQVLASTGQVTATKLGWIGQLYTLAGFAPATGLPLTLRQPSRLLSGNSSMRMSAPTSSALATQYFPAAR